MRFSSHELAEQASLAGISFSEIDFAEFARLKAASKKRDAEDLGHHHFSPAVIQRRNDVFGFGQGTKIIAVHNYQ